MSRIREAQLLFGDSHKFDVCRNKGILGERKRRKQEMAAKYGARVDSGELSLKEASRLAALENEDVTYANVCDAQQHRKRARGKAPSTLGRMEKSSVVAESAATAVGGANSGGGAAAAAEETQPPAAKVTRVFVPVSKNGQIIPGTAAATAIPGIAIHWFSDRRDQVEARKQAKRDCEGGSRS